MAPKLHAVSWRLKETKMSTATPDISNRVISVIAEQLGVDAASVAESVDLVDDLGADSLEVAQIVLELEEQFGVQFPDKMADSLRTVGDAIHFIAALQRSTSK